MLEFYTEYTLAELKEIRNEKYSAKAHIKEADRVKTEQEWDDFFQLKKPNPFTSSFFTSDGVKILVVYANQWPAEVSVPPRRHVSEQPDIDDLNWFVGKGYKIHFNGLPVFSIFYHLFIFDFQPRSF
jgi:hypothetical protein